MPFTTRSRGPPSATVTRKGETRLRAEAEMGRAAVAPVGRSVVLALLFLTMASMVASEGVAEDAGQTGAEMLEAPLDLKLLQLHRQAQEQEGRESSSSHSGNQLLASDAQAAVHDGNKDAAADILMVPTKTKSAAVTATCSYTVTIKTSCSSPKLTRDAISLSFGDGDGNQVYAARLDDPSTGTFEQCSTDTFQIRGPCGGKTCYLYLRRSGFDGWAPDWVKVVPPYSGGQAVIFYYNAAPLPADVWYGFNLCPSDSGGGARVAVRDAAGLALWAVLALLLVVLQPPFLCDCY